MVGCEPYFLRKTAKGHSQEKIMTPTWTQDADGIRQQGAGRSGSATRVIWYRPYLKNLADALAEKDLLPRKAVARKLNFP